MIYKSKTPGLGAWRSAAVILVAPAPAKQHVALKPAAKRRVSGQPLAVARDAAASSSVLVLAIVSGAISGMAFVTVQASIYVELRDVKQGVAPADLEAIFA